MINNIPVANVVLLPTKYMYMLSVIAETKISCFSRDWYQTSELKKENLR